MYLSFSSFSEKSSNRRLPDSFFLLIVKTLSTFVPNWRGCTSLFNVDQSHADCFDDFKQANKQTSNYLNTAQHEQNLNAAIAISEIVSGDINQVNLLKIFFRPITGLSSFTWLRWFRSLLKVQ